MERCSDLKMQLLSAFSAHELLMAYIFISLYADSRSEEIDIKETAYDMLYSVDEAAEREIMRYLADLTDENDELER